ncbi:MAG: metallopeptidase TldD-related protein [Saccharofermentanales bacterium]|jgi:predicted Zn-dependent protease
MEKMEKKIKKALTALREYGLAQDAKFRLLWHHENSHFIRYANSGISLNTSENLNRLYITVYGDKRLARTSLKMDPSNLDQMKKMLDRALMTLEFTGELSYQPTLSAVKSFNDTRCYDADLAEMSSDEMIDFVEQATLNLETNDIVLSGNFSRGETMLCTMTSLSDDVGFWAATDAQVTLVLSSCKNKWEVNAEQSAYRKKNLKSRVLHKQLSFLVDSYLRSKPVQLPLGAYRIVLGAAATAEYLDLLDWLALDGDTVMRSAGMHTKEDLGQLILSDRFNLYDDPEALQTFAYSHDLWGRKREKLALYEQGVYRNFSIPQELADEFGLEANATDVQHLNLALDGGDWEIKDVRELCAEAAEGKKDILYIPYLHYTGVVNPSQGLVTGSSRFGALLFKQDGSIEVPYNVRLTNKLSDLFGSGLVKLAQKRVAYNTSQTYDERNPRAVLVPKFVMLDDIEISHSNNSY